MRVFSPIAVFCLGLMVGFAAIEVFAQAASAGQAEKPEPDSISMPYSSSAWQGVLTIDNSGITEQVNDDKPGVIYHPKHFLYKNLEYCAYYNNSHIYPGVVVVGTKSEQLSGAALSGRFGPNLWILLKVRGAELSEGFAIPDSHSKDFFKAAKLFGKHCESIH